MKAPTAISTFLSREEARRLADRCAALLREQFGARRVILFGSVIGDAPWHDRSDLDLAVSPYLWLRLGMETGARVKPGTTTAPAGAKTTAYLFPVYRFVVTALA